MNSGNDGGVPYETGWNTDWNQPPNPAVYQPYMPATASDWNADLGGAAAPGDGGPAIGPGGGYSTWTPTAANQESLPISTTA